VPPCISEVTFFLALGDDILGVFIFFSKKRDAIIGKRMLPRSSDKKSGIKLVVESPDKSGCLISIAVLSDILI
jgi:hypothetical protein